MERLVGVVLPVRPTLERVEEEERVPTTRRVVVFDVPLTLLPEVVEVLRRTVCPPFTTEVRRDGVL